jgi:hypothetical protein
MLSDDVFRDRLEQVLIEIETYVAGIRDCAAVDVVASLRYWRMIVVPQVPGACPFELIIKADQTFSIRLADQTFEDRPVDEFDLFLKLLRAVEAGHVDKILKFDATTEELIAIAMRVNLTPDLDWFCEHRLAPAAATEEWRAHRYLPYCRRSD